MLLILLYLYLSLIIWQGDKGREYRDNHQPPQPPRDNRNYPNDTRKRDDRNRVDDRNRAAADRGRRQPERPPPSDRSRQTGSSKPGSSSQDAFKIGGSKPNIKLTVINKVCWWCMVLWESCHHLIYSFLSVGFVPLPPPLLMSSKLLPQLCSP